MREETIKIYTIDELDEEAKKKAIEKQRSMEQEYGIDSLPTIMNERLNQLLIEKNIVGKAILFYSLGYSQGDGVCFIGTFNWSKYTIKITHSGMYYHKNSTEIGFFDEEGNDLDLSPEQWEDLENKFKIIYYQICDEVEKEGYGEMDYRLSEESLIEDIRINEYEFLENGERWAK